MEKRERHIILGQYLKDMVFAANDGVVTTFAVVAGVVGADLSITVILIIGLASLLADGFSMATGNYLGTKSEQDLYKMEERLEKEEIKKFPEHERQEIREILAEKGYQGEDLEKIVQLISSNERLWTDFMMHNELELYSPAGESPVRHALATFLAFVVAGSIPLLPYFFGNGQFAVAAVFSGIALFTVGALRKFFSDRSWLISGLEMLLVGGSAAVIAYGIGALIKAFLG